MLPLSLYIHLPWCVKKCPYCDFNSFTASQDAPRSRYLGAVKEDLKRQSADVADRPLHTVFIGGGTPSFFSPEEIGSLVDAVRGHYRLEPGIEITMEANPSSVESGDPAGYRDAGINRLSIGAQSFNDKHLKTLGRLHDVADIERSFSDARSAGFDNINLDVMYALPNQGLNEAMSDLDSAFDLDPDHISWYQLTLEPNTVFYSRPPAGLPDDDAAWELQSEGQARLANAGYRQYEVSAYAQLGGQCRHNLNYWRFGDYLAVGAGAHGKLSIAGEPYRYSRPANPAAYMQSVELNSGLDRRAIPEKDRVFEFALMALRLDEGFSAEQFESALGLPRERLEEALNAPVESGLVEQLTDDRWRPTELGRRFLNDLQSSFLPTG